MEVTVLRSLPWKADLLSGILNALRASPRAADHERLSLRLLALFERARSHV